MNLREYGDKLFGEDLLEMVKNNPYYAFFILAASLEFVAKCRLKLLGKKKPKGISEQAIYTSAINNLAAFSDYRRFNDPRDVNKNKIYSLIRCGLLHTTMPGKDIVLHSEHNDLDNNIVGCVDFYNDVKNAWEEIKNIPCILSYLECNKGLMIVEDNNYIRSKKK